MKDTEASRTAILVCQGRAVGDGRLAPGRFADPVAVRLLRDDERAEVELARSGSAPSGWRARMRHEMLNATAAVLVTRTVVIDDAVREAGNPQLVVLGAGLDARAWRMPELAGTTVFEVDHPASQGDKRERAEGLEPVAKSLTFVPVDFGRDALGPALAAAGHDPAAATTWIWEGVLPYLTATQVESTLAVVAERSAVGSRLVATYPVHNRVAVLGRRALRVYSRLTGGKDPLEHERHISAWTPEQMGTLLAGYGLTVTTDRDLHEVVRELELPARESRFYGLGRVSIADRSS
ncbi:class I SAM-dependent methyltransferase [Nocardia miyunensis]|uniref:class I SAM-dependent methyltransferase n=1 Tax=Nocardia miyunensis TaxID=282684 RepID=UPI00082D0C5E|nr:SAM-dependent methyltransferase [Nocardia miyunensis]